MAFDNQSYGGGGRSMFMGDGHDSPSNTDSPTKAKRSGASNQSLTPLTVKQLGQASQITSDDVFKVDGHDLNMVTIVGAIVGENRQTTNITYDVDDGTGVIKARIWIESEDSSDYIARQLAQVRVGGYVRIVGHLRAFGGERSLVAFRVIPITDFNEVTFHHLEVIQVHLFNTRPSPVSQGGYSNNNTNSFYNNNNNNNNSNSNNSNNFNNPNYNNQNNNYNTPYVSGQAPQGGNFTDLQRAILSALRAANPNLQEGVPIQHIVHSLSGMASEHDITRDINFLVSEGHAFSTIDDAHIKASQQ